LINYHFISLISWMSLKLVSNIYFYYFNNTLIIIDTMLLVWSESLTDDIYLLIEFLIGIYYSFEMITKIFAYGLIFNSDSYLRNKWNILDFSIALSIIFSRSFYLIMGLDFGVFRNLVVLRLLRVRSFDLILERLYFIMKDLFKTLFFVCCILTILGTVNLHLLSGILKYRCMDLLTGATHDDELCGNYACEITQICIQSLNNLDNGVSNYDNIFSSMLQLLKIITFNNWTDSVFLVQKTFLQFSFLYFLLWIIVGNFIVLNLILAILKVKYSEGVSKIENANKMIYKVFDFRKIKNYTLMLGKKMDSNLFDNQICNSFMNTLYSLKFNQIKLHKFPKLEGSVRGVKRKKKMNLVMKIANKYLCLGRWMNKPSKNPLDILWNKHLELIVDFKMKYDFPDIQDVLLDQ